MVVLSFNNLRKIATLKFLEITGFYVILPDIFLQNIYKSSKFEYVDLAYF